MAESEKELKSLLMEVKEESEKVSLKLSIQEMKVMASGPIASWQIDGKQWKQWQTLFSWAPESLQRVTAVMKSKMLVPWKKSMANLDSILKSRTKGLSSQSCGFSPSHVWMWELGHKQSWVLLMYWCFWTVVLKTLENSLDCK